MIIYKATNKINGKSYIGQTKEGLRIRSNNHENGRKNTVIENAIKKYGKENFSWEILECCNSKSELDEMEFHYIKQYDSFSPNGYNLTLGGEGSYGYKPNEETKRKVSKSMKGIIPWNKGKTMSEEARIKMSNSRKGRVVSKETRQKISKSIKLEGSSKERARNMKRDEKGRWICQ